MLFAYLLNSCKSPGKAGITIFYKKRKMKIKFGDMPVIIQIVKGQGHIQTQSLSLHYMDHNEDQACKYIHLTIFL